MLKPYEATLARWLWPDVFKNQDTSVAKAKKAIADYRKASGAADGLAELMVFHCACAAGLGCDVGMDVAASPPPDLSRKPCETDRRRAQGACALSV